MNMHNITYNLICILILLLVTHATRAVPITLIKCKIKNRFVASLLDYIPFAVISFLTFPSVFEIKGMGLVPNLAGFLAAVLLSYKEKNLLVVSLSATLVSLLLMFVEPYFCGLSAR